MAGLGLRSWARRNVSHSARGIQSPHPAGGPVVVRHVPAAGHDLEGFVCFDRDRAIWPCSTSDRP